MELPLFTQTPHCTSGKHCATCRDPQRRAWRQSLSAAFRLPGDDVDFDCPHGKPWGLGDAPPAVMAAVQQFATAVRKTAHAVKSIAKTSVGIDRATPEQVEARLNICRRCPGGHAVWDSGGGDVHTCGPMVESLKGAGKGTCGCILTKKALDWAEHCPFGWWPGDDQAAR